MTPMPGNIERHGGRRLPWHTLSLLLLGVALYVFGGPAPEVLVFDRQAIDGGQYWRLVTGHWVHADTEHLFWNLLALAVLGWLLESSRNTLSLYETLIVGMFFVSAWVWIFIPSLDYYCGLSGILNTLLFFILIDGRRRTGKMIFIFVGIGALAKIAFEITHSSAILTNTRWPAVPEAHLAGALATLLLSHARADPPNAIDKYATGDLTLYPRRSARERKEL